MSIGTQELIVDIFILLVIVFTIWYISFRILNHMYIHKMYHSFGIREAKIGKALMFVSDRGWMYQTDDFELFIFEKNNQVFPVRIKIVLSVVEYEKFRSEEEVLFLASYRIKRKLKHEDRNIAFSANDLHNNLKDFFIELEERVYESTNKKAK